MHVTADTARQGSYEDPHNFAADDGTDFTDRRDFYTPDYYDDYRKERRRT